MDAGVASGFSHLAPRENIRMTSFLLSSRAASEEPAAASGCGLTPFFSSLLGEFSWLPCSSQPSLSLLSRPNSSASISASEEQSPSQNRRFAPAIE